MKKNIIIIATGGTIAGSVRPAERSPEAEMQEKRPIIRQAESMFLPSSAVYPLLPILPN